MVFLRVFSVNVCRISSYIKNLDKPESTESQGSGVKWGRSRGIVRNYVFLKSDIKQDKYIC